MTLGKILPRLAIALLIAIAFATFSFIREDGSGPGEFLEALIIPLIVCGVVYSGWIVAGSEDSQQWDGFKAAFPAVYQVEEFTREPAFGPLSFDNTGVPPLVVVLAGKQALFISKAKKHPKNEDFVCVPWSRIKKVEVPRPTKLSSSASRNDCLKLARTLQAKLTVLRGDFPPFHLMIPWNDSFERDLPPDVELERDWNWPSPIGLR